MRKNAETDYSITELLLITRSWWKKLIVFALLGALLFAGYGIISAKDASDEMKTTSGGTNTDFQKDQESYDLYQKNKDSAPSSLKSEWADLYEDHSNNPIYSVNPYQCEYEQIVLRFEDASHDDNVMNWIMSADDKQLFGEAEKQLAPFKSSLIITPIRNSDYVEVKDTTVQIIRVEGFDVEKAADYLKGFFLDQSKKEDLAIKGLSVSKAEGYNANVANYQKNSREALTSVYNALDKANNVGAFISKPVTDETEKTSGIKDLVKYVLAGLVLGILIGVAVMAFSIVKRNCIISRRQIEERFDIEMLADYSSGEKLALDVLNANLDLMTKEGNQIMVISLPVDNCELNPVDYWNKQGDRHFTRGYDLSNDPETIDALQDKDGIVLCVRLGLSKPEDIQRTVLRAQVLKKPVLGYVLV